MTDDHNDLKWKEISTEHIVQDEWIDFRKSAFRFPDGNIYEPFYTYSRRDYVVIVPVDIDGDLICVRQYRQGIRRVTTEFPAGGLERADGKEYRPGHNGSLEDALVAARRELQEETGYQSDSWRHLITLPSNATISDNYVHVYLAQDCIKVSGQALDEMEFVNVELHTQKELEAMICSGNFQQSDHVMAWLLAKETLDTKDK